MAAKVTAMMTAMTIATAALAAAARPRGEAVDQLRWLAGSWASDSGGVRIEEHWAAPHGGVMIGMHRDVIGGRATGFEFFRIREDSAGLVLLAQPGGRPPHAFRVKELTSRRVVFEDAAHDFPQRVMYWLDSRGRLHARAEGFVNGRLQGENWRWSRSSLFAPKAGRRGGAGAE